MALPDRKDVSGHEMPPLSLATLQNEMWERVGVVRNAEGLASTAETLATWERHMVQATDRPSHELANLVLLGRLVTEAALTREESRGAHYRTDFPDISEHWQRHIVLSHG